MPKAKKNHFKIALLFGGPSLERGISLNSARSIADHLESEQIEIVPVYFDQKKRPYQISRAQLYSNTPSDFDFKLAQTARPLSASSLKRLLKSADLVFPIIHGEFGEDGKVQAMLEKLDVPFVGPSSKTCRAAFDKYAANEALRKAGFYAPQSLLIKKTDQKIASKIAKFFKTQKIKKAVVKPAAGGSSIAVHAVKTSLEAAQAATSIFRQKIDQRVVVEPFCKGREFTVVLFDNKFGEVVSAIPTEIELEEAGKEIFDYRKKYLAGKRVTYHCPPTFSDEVVRKIQTQAEDLYRFFGFRDFSRFDGWVLDNGEIWFSDFNPLSGMEQNSFLFMQASRLGFSHRDILEHIVKNACKRYGIVYPKRKKEIAKKKEQIDVIFGGSTAEKQVSLMSGTNVWLKLKNSQKYLPEPYFLDSKNNVWKLPYAFALNHSVEEVEAMCLSAKREERRLQSFKNQVLKKLLYKESELSAAWSLPVKMSLREFIRKSKFVFIALHGGIGEDGTLQKMLEQKRISFNGPGSRSSRLCADKYQTGMAVLALNQKGITIAPKSRVPISSLAKLKRTDFQIYWKMLGKEFLANSIVVKPVDDGCSAGIARLREGSDLEKYLAFARFRASFIPENTLQDQSGIIEMPEQKMKNLLFEAFVETDKTFVKNNKLYWRERTNWIEITVGLLEEKGKLRALSPSITIASGSVLSLEEKFQGGTGVNITPPPKEFVSSAAVQKAKRGVELVAKALGISGYSRIDAFVHRKTGELIIIEANTLPGLTASTVIYHQALAEKVPLNPCKFLEKIIEAGRGRVF